jgi:hypothetical protein
MTVARKGAEPILTVSSAAEWHEWLAFRHGGSEGVLLRIAKKVAEKTMT